ncbi:hypothetical protein Avbf_18770 [Armadillidium vulgare]|nr:hypothetical protein Avbf_18770 [Armadillidium vulgare]
MNRKILVKKVGPIYFSAVVGFQQLVHFSVSIHRSLAHVGTTLERKLGERYEGPFVVTKVVSEGMAYEIEGIGKNMKAHYSHLKIWADPPPYLQNYFQKEEKTELIQENLQTEYKDEDRSENELIKYTPSESNNLFNGRMQRRKSQSQKKTWEAVKQIATEVVWKKCNSSTQTNSVGVTDKCTQTRDVYISPLIESNEYLDWFDEEDGNSQESSEFDLQKFEKSLLFPEQSYTLGTMVSSISSIEDTSIDFIAKELGIRTFGRVRRIQRKLLEGKWKTVKKGRSEPIGLLESKEHEENSRNSQPKTGSRGPVLDAPNVQEKILEYRGRTEAKKRFYQGQCPTKSNSKFKLSNLEDSKLKTFKSNCVVNIELLKFVKTNKTSDPVRTVQPWIKDMIYYDYDY